MKRFVQSLLAMKPVAVQFRLMVMAMMLVAGPMASAELSVSKLFGDGMVLQRDKPVKVWGWAEPGEAVTVSFAGQAVDAKADAQGKWVATIEPMEASFDARNVVVAGKSQTLTIKDVLVGEVWLCGGQSNMAWSLGGSLDSGIEIASASTPAIRYLKLGMVASNEIPRDVPLDEGKGWLPCVPESARDCTAVGYYFAKRIQRRLNVPVGIIENAWGGTMAQYWCSRTTLETFPAMKKDLDAFDASVKAWIDGGEEAGAQKRLDAAIAEWEVDRMEALREERRVPGKPKLQIDPRTLRQPAGMYNTLVAPMAGLSLRGVLFYQGENNSFGESWKPFYATYPGVIKDWRAVFNDDEMPFGLIQIAGWSNRRSMSYDQNHHTNVVRELQFKTWQDTPGTGLIVTYDTNSDGNIHPKNKRPVGERSARWALSAVYGAKDSRGNALGWRGPVYESYKVEGDKVVVQFDKATTNGLRLDKDDVRGFYIAGEDKLFHHAEWASIDRSAGTVSVWSAKVPRPAAVRYAISNLPIGSLKNAREIPAYPFRTDTWPITPHQSKGSFHADKNPPVVGP